MKKKSEMFYKQGRLYRNYDDGTIVLILKELDNNSASRSEKCIMLWDDGRVIEGFLHPSIRGEILDEKGV